MGPAEDDFLNPVLVEKVAYAADDCTISMGIAGEPQPPHDYEAHGLISTEGIRVGSIPPGTVFTNSYMEQVAQAVGHKVRQQLNTTSGLASRPFLSAEMKEIRMHALEMAVQSRAAYDHPSEVVHAAELFEKYILGTLDSPKTTA